MSTIKDFKNESIRQKWDKWRQLYVTEQKLMNLTGEGLDERVVELAETMKSEKVAIGKKIQEEVNFKHESWEDIHALFRSFGGEIHGPRAAQGRAVKLEDELGRVWTGLLEDDPRYNSGVDFYINAFDGQSCMPFEFKRGRLYFDRYNPLTGNNFTRCNLTAII